jgi:hypothetical protein
LIATLPLLVRQGDPAGAAQLDMGQPWVSTLRYPSFTRRVFHGVVSCGYSFETTYETANALFVISGENCFMCAHL